MIVQDLFKDIDISILADRFSNYSDCIRNIKTKMGDNEYLKLIDDTVKELLDIRPTYSNDYLVVSKVFDYDVDDISKIEEGYDAYLIFEKDLLDNAEYIRMQADNFNLDLHKNKYINAYSLFLTPREEILGYKFSNYLLNIIDKYDILSTVLFELTWFGFDNETAEQNMKQQENGIDASVKEIIEHPENLVSFEDIIKDIFGDDLDKSYDVQIPNAEQMDAIIQINTEPLFKCYRSILDELEKEKKSNTTKFISCLN